MENELKRHVETTISFLDDIINPMKSMSSTKEEIPKSDRYNQIKSDYNDCMEMLKEIKIRLSNKNE